MNIKTASLSVVFFSLSLNSFAQTKPPTGFDAKARLKTIQMRALKDSLSGKLDLQKIESRKVDVGAQKLMLVTALYATGKNESDPGYNLSEIYSEASQPPSLLFQMIDKSTCDSKLIEDVTVKKLGFVNETQIYLAQVQFRPPVCPNSVTNPKIFLVLQERQKKIEKVYQSDVSENGRYRISFQKEVLKLEYAKNLDSPPKEVELHWNPKTQKLEMASAAP